MVSLTSVDVPLGVSDPPRASATAANDPDGDAHMLDAYSTAVAGVVARVAPAVARRSRGTRDAQQGCAIGLGVGLQHHT